jgi:S-adenosylmethionine synthetase
VQLSYAIGSAEPASLRVRTFGTGKADDQQLTARLREVIDFRLGSIVRNLQLQKLPAQRSGGFYEQLAVYGQMGRIDLDVPWERTDKADALK